MTAPNSYQTILRSSSIIGAAQFVNIILGIVKMKAVAILLGPAGVGLIGLFMNLMQTASAVAALGLGTVGTREIAAAQAEGGEPALERVRKSLFWLTLILAVAGGVVFWLSSGWLTRTFVLTSGYDAVFIWLALGVTFSVGSSFYTAVLVGMRQVGDMALVTIAAATAAALFGVAAIWVWGGPGIVAMVVAMPLATLVFGRFFVARLGLASGHSKGVAEIVGQWPAMIRLGVPFMLSGLVTLLAQLAVRRLVQEELGPEALGHFQAAWAIGMMYVGWILGAMATDFYPRLSAVIKDNTATARLVNEQTEVALLLCAPFLLLMLGVTPWVISLLYSADFYPAVEILRWQILGDILKVMSFPLGFLLLARSAGKSFILAESTGYFAFVLVTWIGLPLIGLTATGIGFLVMYVVYLPFVWWLAKRSNSFRWSSKVLGYSMALVIAAVSTVSLAQFSAAGAAGAGVVFAAVAGVYGASALSEHIETAGRLGRLLVRVQGIVKWRR